MNNTEVNEAIVRWMGWEWRPPSTVLHPSRKRFWIPFPTSEDEIARSLECELPNFTGDLNACFEFEEKLRNDGSGAWADYTNRLGFRDCLTYGGVWELVHATAARKAEALLKTLGLWQD